MRIRILLCLTLATTVLVTGCDNTNTGNSSDDRNFLERAWAQVENSFSDTPASAPTAKAANAEKYAGADETTAAAPTQAGADTAASGQQSVTEAPASDETPPTAEPSDSQDTAPIETADAAAAPDSAQPNAEKAQAKAAPDTGEAEKQSIDIPDVEIGYKKYVLDNGLTLIVHTDHKTPIVAVNIWYHVGSKNEGPGQHGFAHLFEHLMFKGTRKYGPGEFSDIVSANGGSGGLSAGAGSSNGGRPRYRLGS